MWVVGDGWFYHPLCDLSFRAQRLAALSPRKVRSAESRNPDGLSLAMALREFSQSSVL
jgi:hypothetical protein